MGGFPSSAFRATPVLRNRPLQAYTPTNNYRRQIPFDSIQRTSKQRPFNNTESPLRGNPSPLTTPLKAPTLIHLPSRLSLANHKRFIFGFRMSTLYSQRNNRFEGFLAATFIEKRDYSVYYLAVGVDLVWQSTVCKYLGKLRFWVLIPPPDCTMLLGVVDEALRLMKQMEGSGYFPNVFTYTILIDGFLNAKRADEAFTVLQTMKEKNVVPNAATMRSLVHGVFCCMTPDKAFELLLEFVEKKQRVSQLVCDNILYYLSNNSMASEAVMFLSKIGKKGYVPDSSIFKPGFSTYLTLIEALYKAGKMEIGNQYMDRIINDGLISSVYSYNMVIDCLCKGKLMDRASEIFRDLHYKGISPNVVTYNTLISGYCRNGNMEKAQELLEMLLDCRFKPDIFTFNSLIDGLCQAHKHEDAFDIFTFNSLIDGLCQAHKHEDAFGCFTEMIEWDVTPDATTYNILIRSFCAIGDLLSSDRVQKVEKLFDSMLRLGIQPDNYTYAALIKSLCKLGRHDEAREMFLSMKITNQVFELLCETLGTFLPLLSPIEKTKLQEILMGIRTVGFTFSIYDGDSIAELAVSGSCEDAVLVNRGYSYSSR
ncbi:unnamed protein product [Citrullus colocynthis]|uniref:Pentatricopeptide repeat-containing protein n=1 Tax=Citrullus colocynthis TaxID=252529 RepID=A0ABP0YDK5_9ROSI